MLTLSAFCQTKTITGKIINEDFEILNGATIQSLDSIYTAQSDDKGEFRLEVPKNCKKNSGMAHWYGTRDGGAKIKMPYQHCIS